MADINLLPEEERKSESIENIKGKITLVSITVLVLTAISAFITLAFFTFLSKERSEHLDNVAQAVIEVESYKDVEELLAVTKDKSSNALLITNDSKDKVKLLTEFAQLIPQYTRPEKFRRLTVPSILLSGDHNKILNWRKTNAAILTKKNRPQLLKTKKE